MNGRTAKLLRRHAWLATVLDPPDRHWTLKDSKRLWRILDDKARYKLRRVTWMIEP